jgi:hypothetical protein
MRGVCVPNQAALPAPPSGQLLGAVAASLAALQRRRAAAAAGAAALSAATNALRCARTPLYGCDLAAAARVERPVDHVHLIAAQVYIHI